MKNALSAVVFVVLLSGIAQANSYDVAERSRRSGVCVLHQTKLVDRTAFDIVLPPRTTIDLDNVQAAIWEKYPNAMYPIYKRRRHGDYRKAVQVTYCPVCQKLYEQEFARRH